MAACDQRSESRRYQYGVRAQESGQSQKYVFTCDVRIKLTIVILFIFKHEDCVYISFLISFTKISILLCERVANCFHERNINTCTYKHTLTRQHSC